jgi:hypothetical protein
VVLLFCLEPSSSSMWPWTGVWLFSCSASCDTSSEGS